MKTFRKLIRDRIPEIMAADGVSATTRILDDAEFLQALENKLLEEVQELRSERDAEHRKMEIADIYEVLETLIRAEGFSKDEIEILKQQKRVDRGGFDKKILLEGTS